MFLEPPEDLEALVAGLRYRVRDSTLLARDFTFPLGLDRATYLYQTPGGRYFAVYVAQGEKARLEPLSREEALELYLPMPRKFVPLEEAFPGLKFEPA